MIYFIGNGSIDESKIMYASIDFIESQCRNAEIISIDTETTGLDYTGDSIIMLQIGTETDQFVIDTRNINIKPLYKILEQKLKILHNAKFDYLFLKAHGIEIDNVYDTMLADRVINCGRKMKYSLKALISRYLKKDMSKEARQSFISIGEQPFTTEQVLYGALDVKYLFNIRAQQLKKIEEYKLGGVVKLENRAVLAFADIEYNGLDINKDSWENLYKQNQQKSNDLFIKLDSLVLEDGRLQKFKPESVQMDMFTDFNDLRKLNINWASPKQTLSVFKSLIKSLENVNSKQLNKHRFKYPLIDTYIKYKETMKLCTSYGELFYSNFKADGRIHTSFHQILETGRVSSKGPNMQQIPADNAFRNCFTAPTGWKFVSSDYSSQELNVIAFGSKDPVWIEALKKGQDLHSVCAELVYGKLWIDNAEDDCIYFRGKTKCDCPRHKSMRTNIKTVNFGLAYGMGPHKLSDTLGIPMNDAKLLINKYFKAFPAIGGFLNKLGNFGKKYRYIKTFPPFNRRRWFEFETDQIDPKQLGIIERASKNTPIQGASADMTKLALVLIRDYIKVTNCPVKLVMTVHDQIDTICEESYVTKWTLKLKELMELAAKTIVTNGLLKAEVTVSNYWQK